MAGMTGRLPFGSRTSSRKSCVDDRMQEDAERARVRWRRPRSDRPHQRAGRRVVLEVPDDRLVRGVRDDDVSGHDVPEGLLGGEGRFGRGEDIRPDVGEQAELHQPGRVGVSNNAEPVERSPGAVEVRQDVKHV